MSERSMAGGQERSSAQAGEQRQPAREPGNFIIDVASVPPEVREYAINKLSPRDEAGAPIKVDGKEVRAGISTAREGGSYYGPVIMNNDKFLVQAVGKDRNFAVVHPKEKVELQGAALANLDAKRSMNGFSVQIHYTGDKAKAYPWTEKAKEKTEEKTVDKAAEKAKVDPKELVAQAQAYAAENIKNPKQREAFLKHMQAVAEQANKPQERAHVASKAAPEAGKAKDAGDKGQER